MFDFQGKNVIITGGTRGIGLGIVKKYIEVGAKVIVGARKKNENIEKLGSKAVFVETDVRIFDSMKNLIRYSINNFDSIDILINNAGISVWRSIAHVDEEFWNLLIDTNLKGTFWGCKAAAEYMKRGSVIINIASLAGKRGGKNNSVYVASKFGVVGITQALAKELGPRGIRVNSLCPVYVRTDELVSNLKGDHPDVGDMNPNVFLDIFARNNAALERLPTISEIANMCLFLSSSMASAITGQNINIDCGVLPQ